jgi:hypothetical protein
LQYLALYQIVSYQILWQNYFGLWPLASVSSFMELKMCTLTPIIFGRKGLKRFSGNGICAVCFSGDLGVAPMILCADLH